MASERIDIDEAALEKACTEADGLLPRLEQRAKEIAERAEALGSDFATEETTDWASGMRMGGQSPRYRADAKVGRKGPVGIVATANYAAMKGELEGNFLLKAKG